MNKYILIFLLMTLSASAQTAKVIELSKEDAKTAKSLFDQKKEIEDKINNFNKHIIDSYLITPEMIYSWNNSFEFSENFKFIVPIKQTPSPCLPQNYYNSGGIPVYCPNMYAVPVVAN